MQLIGPTMAWEPHAKQARGLRVWLVLAAHIACVWAALMWVKSPAFARMPTAVKALLVMPEVLLPPPMPAVPKPEKLAKKLPDAPKPPEPLTTPPPMLDTPLRESAVAITAAPVAAQAPISQPAPMSVAVAVNAEPAPVRAAVRTAPAVAPPAPAVVVPPSSNADYLNNPAPPYPAVAKRLGESGRVVVRALVSAEGQVMQVELRASSGFERLDAIALATVKQWRFKPGTRGGVADAMWVNVPIDFKLD